jgi:hypothetical protein
VRGRGSRRRGRSEGGRCGRRVRMRMRREGSDGQQQQTWRGGGEPRSGRGGVGYAMRKRRTDQLGRSSAGAGRSRAARGRSAQLARLGARRSPRRADSGAGGVPAPASPPFARHARQPPLPPSAERAKRRLALSRASPHPHAVPSLPPLPDVRPRRKPRAVAKRSHSPLPSRARRHGRCPRRRARAKTAPRPARQPQPASDAHEARRAAPRDVERWPRALPQPHLSCAAVRRPRCFASAAQR